MKTANGQQGFSMREGVRARDIIGMNEAGVLEGMRGVYKTHVHLSEKTFCVVYP